MIHNWNVQINYNFNFVTIFFIYLRARSKYHSSDGSNQFKQSKRKNTIESRPILNYRSHSIWTWCIIINCKEEERKKKEKKNRKRKIISLKLPEKSWRKKEIILNTYYFLFDWILNRRASYVLVKYISAVYRCSIENIELARRVNGERCSAEKQYFALLHTSDCSRFRC